VRSFPALSSTGEPIVVVPLRALTDRFAQILQPPSGGVFSVLAMGTASPVAATRAAGFQVTNVADASTIESQLASRQENLAIGMEFAASVAGALLAVLALALAVFFASRRHEYEFASLEAIGGRVQDASYTLAVEYGLVIVVSLALGVAAGIGLVALALPFFASAPSGISAELVIDWPAIVIASGAAVSTLALAICIATVRVRNLSPVSLLRGEPE
jgi:putative ABC transport system permease protein